MTLGISRVGAVASVFNGKTPAKSEQREEGHPVLKIKDVDELGQFRGNYSGWVGSELATKHKRKWLEGGETLILNAAHSSTHVASKTFFAVDGVKGSLATGEWLMIKWNKETVDARYGNHWVNWPHTRFKLSQLVNGIHLYPKDVARLQIPLPPLPEQKRIAAILDAADALRAKRRESLAQLDTLLQSTFLDLFGDPVTNPKGWETAQLSDIVKDGTIVTYGIVQAGEEYAGGVPYIRTGDLVNGEIRLTDLRHTAPEIAAKFERSRVRSGEIVMSIRATVGTTALVPSELEGANLTQGTARIAPGKNTHKFFLLHFLRAQGSQNWLQRQVKGAIFREITLKRLREMPIHVPPISLQNRFSNIVESVERQKSSLRAHLAELDTLFASLQSRAFNGEL